MHTSTCTVRRPGHRAAKVSAYTRGAAWAPGNLHAAGVRADALHTLSGGLPLPPVLLLQAPYGADKQPKDAAGGVQVKDFAAAEGLLVHLRCGDAEQAVTTVHLALLAAAKRALQQCKQALSWHQAAAQAGKGSPCAQYDISSTVGGKGRCLADAAALQAYVTKAGAPKSTSSSVRAWCCGTAPHAHPTLACTEECIGSLWHMTACPGETSGEECPWVDAVQPAAPRVDNWRVCAGHWAPPSKESPHLPTGVGPVHVVAALLPRAAAHAVVTHLAAHTLPTAVHLAGVHHAARGSPDCLTRLAVVRLDTLPAPQAALECGAALSRPSLGMLERAAAHTAVTQWSRHSAQPAPWHLAHTLYDPLHAHVPGCSASWAVWGATVWTAWKAAHGLQHWVPRRVPWSSLRTAVDVLNTCFPPALAAAARSVTQPLACYVQLAAAVAAAQAWGTDRSVPPPRLCTLLLRPAETKQRMTCTAAVASHAVRVFYWSRVHPPVDAVHCLAAAVEQDSGALPPNTSAALHKPHSHNDGALDHAADAVRTLHASQTVLMQYATHGWYVSMRRMYRQRGAVRAKAPALQLLQ